MKKNVFGRQFKRDVNERKALFKNLLTSLVIEESIKTTEAKAKAIKGAADKLITKAKKGGVAAYRGLEADVNHNAVVKLIEDLGPRFASRSGGYTRAMKIGNRVADNAPMVMMEWVEKKAVTIAKEAKAPKKEVKKAEAKKVETKKVENKIELKKSPVKKADVKQVRSAAGRKTGGK
jgi:large subunit ribosomal protein L17